MVLTIDDNNTVTAVSLDYTYDKDVYSGSSLNDLEESFEKYIIPVWNDKLSLTIFPDEIDIPEKIFVPFILTLNFITAVYIVVSSIV